MFYVTRVNDSTVLKPKGWRSRCHRSSGQRPADSGSWHQDWEATPEQL